MDVDSGAGRLTTKEQIDLRLRYNAGEAGFAAVLLLLFGFMMFAPSDTATGLFKLGDRLSIYGMRAGGLALALIAVASKFHVVGALLADAAVSIGVGLALGFGGLAMGYDGGWGINNILYLIFGFMFCSAGIRNGRDYFTIASTVARAPVGHRGVSRPAERVPAEPRSPSVEDDPETASLAERLRKRVTDSTVILPSPAVGPQRQSTKHSDQPPGTASRSKTDQSMPTAEPPPGGFLASFAKKKDGSE